MKTLSQVKFFRIALLSPFLVPLIALALVLANIPTVLAYALLPLAFGGVPYLLFVIFAWWWMGNKTPREISIFALLAPLLFIPLQGIFLLLPNLFPKTIGGHWYVRTNLQDSLQICCFDLIVGYGHVIVTFLAWQGLRQRSEKVPD